MHGLDVIRATQAARASATPATTPSLVDATDSPRRRQILHGVNEALKETAAFVPVLVLLGADTPIDVDGLKQRLDSLPHTNNEVWDLWVTSGHGAGLAERVASDAQKLLNQALIPTTEFSFHDQVMNFAKTRFDALDSKVTAQPMDDNPSPVWDDVASYLIDGSNLANMLEGTLNQTVKWTDVKAAAAQATQGAGTALTNVAKTAKWVTYSLIGGAVVLGVGALYAIYKIASGPTGGAIIGGYLGGRR